MEIPFNKTPITEHSSAYLLSALQSRHVSGDGAFTKECTQWLTSALGAECAYMTTSGSHALEMAAYLAGIKPGDEVIMPSYTFSSTANAFLGRGAKIVFVDIRPDTMNIDEALIEAAITPKTRAIVPVHYGGVSCEMDAIGEIAKRHGLLVIEDAAQALMSEYKGQMLGNLSDFGCFSFHETKNFSMGEGGAIVMHDARLAEQAEIIREKGTDRSKFFRGQTDKYSWMDWGSSYLPGELPVAYLWSQLEIAQEITDARLVSWNRYYEGLKDLAGAGEGVIELPVVPDGCKHNAHMFYIKAQDIKARTQLLGFLREQGICAAYHYIPLHSARAGRRYTAFFGEDKYTTEESERLLRLPMYYGLKGSEIDFVVDRIREFYRLG
ncbi:MAG: dTDP-4-amino-4,6-dideoxygalactose transaminase [Clostridiales Family XIII bacterium]|nr:dTDP-4-amino-4,6-dideoxygalactose transaminase [Clostridiales Family XIII bacterium]